MSVVCYYSPGGSTSLCGGICILSSASYVHVWSCDRFALLTECLPRRLRAKVGANKQIGVTCVSFSTDDEMAFLIGSESGGVFRCSTQSRGAHAGSMQTSSVSSHTCSVFTYRVWLSDMSFIMTDKLIMFFFMPLPNIVWPETYCFCPVHPCASVHASVCASQNVNTISCRVFDTFLPNLHQRCIMGQMYASKFGVKMSKVKVTMY